MNQQRPPPVKDNTPMLHKSWHNPMRPPNTICAENVLEYFCDVNNPFYEATSDNQNLIMQQRSFIELPRLTGTQYILVHTCGPLFVIGKYKRQSESNVMPLCYYYVMNGTVYQCPDVYTFVQARVVHAVNPLREALAKATQLSRFDVNKGYTWNFEVEPAKTSETLDEEKEKSVKKSWYQNPNSVRATDYQRRRAKGLLDIVLSRFPPVNGIKPGEGQNPTVERMDIDQSAPASVATSAQHATPRPQ